MVAGVCNGLAAYFGIDPTIVRLVFVVLLFLSGGLIAIAYLVLMFVVPTAKTAGGTRGGARVALQCTGTRRAGQASLRRPEGQHPALARKTATQQGARVLACKGKRDYERPHSRPFDRPQPGYGAQVAAGIVLPLIGVISAVLTVACSLRRSRF